MKEIFRCHQKSLQLKLKLEHFFSKTFTIHSPNLSQYVHRIHKKVVKVKLWSSRVFSRSVAVLVE